MRPAVAGAVRLRGRLPTPAGVAACVLGWHRVDAEGAALAVHPAQFARQMEMLQSQRQRVPVVGMEDARGALGCRSGSRFVVLTFDDGWADNHTNALPLLRHYRLPATLYVPSRMLGEPGYMTAGQLLEMDAGGVAVGAHSRTHADLRSCGPAELEREVRGSKEDLEGLIGKPVTSFAYPAGLLDERVVAAVLAAGFATAVTSKPGWWRPQTSDLVVPRGFAGNFSDATFLAATKGGLGILRHLDAINRLRPAGLPAHRVAKP